ncbi:MAG TPA: DUF1990 domain-containing protein [Isosphaeraceae bacterium]
MLSVTRPTESRIDAFLDRQRGLPLSYPDVGCTLGEPPAGYVLDQNQVRLGEGEPVYHRAVAALRRWAMFDVGWVEIRPPGAPIAEGTTVAILGRALGVWSLFACRIVRVIEEHGPVEAFGFANGTLPGHMLGGEERFLVQWDRREGSVWYDLRALSRPTRLGWRLGYPLVRRVQRRFAPESLRALARAVAGGERGKEPE